ncbi:MAG: PAS domain-containing protein [Terracidiphilus sp.]
MNPWVEEMPAAREVAAPEAEVLDAIDELPVSYMELDERGVVTRANRATMALHPPAQGALVGRLAWELMATDEKDPSFAAYMSLMESGDDPPVVRRSLFDRSGQFRTYEMHRSLIRDREGKPCGMRMVSIDVTDTLRALEEARQTRRWLENAMESVAEAVILTDALGFIRSLNPALEELLGWKAAELMGKVVERVIPIVSFTATSSNRFSYNAALQQRLKGIAKVIDREGRELRLEMSTAPLVDKASGFTSGVVTILRRVDE